MLWTPDELPDPGKFFIGWDVCAGTGDAAGTAVISNSDSITIIIDEAPARVAPEPYRYEWQPPAERWWFSPPGPHQNIAKRRPLMRRSGCRRTATGVINFRRAA